MSKVSLTFVCGAQSKLAATLEELATLRQAAQAQATTTHQWEQSAKTAELRVQQLELELDHLKLNELNTRQQERSLLSIDEKEALLAAQVCAESLQSLVFTALES